MITVTKSKLKSHKEIVQTVQKLKTQGKKIVTLNGSFDILHLGHIRALQEAKHQGDVLIVLLNSDKSIKSYKGPARPINSQKARTGVLSSVECIDYLVLFNEITPKKILAKIKPDIFCQGSDWGKDCIERGVVEKYGGNVYVLKWAGSFSTSTLIRKIIDIHSKPQDRAVFLDRDGTVNINRPEYLYRIEDFRFAPGAILALQKLSELDYEIIIVTNQSGIGRGYFKESDVSKLHNWLINELKKNGIRIDRVYYCPHLPRDNCSCRKPKIGMLLKAAKDFNISLAKSWLIGDDERDIIMAREANLKTIKIGEKMNKKLEVEPNYYVENLKEAVEIIISHE